MTAARDTSTPRDPYLRARPPEPVAGQPSPPPAEPGRLSYVWQAYPWVRIAAVGLCLALVGLAVWLAFIRPNDETATAEPGGGPVGITEADLAALSARLGQPIYWAGKRADTQLEATVTTNDYVYVRYLTGGARAGDSSPEFLTVATYPAVDALGNLRSYAVHGHADISRIPGGGIAVPVPGSPTSVYFASPRSDYQVEVYDPNQGEALRLIKSGEVVPVPGGAHASVRPNG